MVGKGNILFQIFLINLLILVDLFNQGTVQIDFANWATLTHTLGLGGTQKCRKAE